MKAKSIKMNTETIPQLSMSYSNYPNERRFLFLFGYCNGRGWWSKYITGFTHIIGIELLPYNIALVFEPLLSHCSTEVLIGHPTLEELKHWTVIELDVLPTNKNRLINAVFQTCATFIQYIAGISFNDCVLVQELYNALMNSSKETLNRNGILRIKKWEVQKAKEELGDSSTNSRCFIANKSRHKVQRSNNS